MSQSFFAHSFDRLCVTGGTAHSSHSVCACVRPHTAHKMGWQNDLGLADVAEELVGDDELQEDTGAGASEDAATFQDGDDF